MKSLILFSVLLTSVSATASDIKDQALKLVPNGTILEVRPREIKVKTTQDTIVEVEFKKDGSFEEASGNNPEKDVFEPGNDLMSLSSAVKKMKDQGKTPMGDWSLEKSFIKGWHYEFEGFENTRKYDYIMDAKTGSLESQLDE